MNLSYERRAFEQAYSREVKVTCVAFFTNPDGSYALPIVNTAWRIWQGRAALSARALSINEGKYLDCPAVDRGGIHENADRYLWLRNHAVRIQGSDMWYQGAALDIRVDVGRDRMAVQAKSVQEGGVLLLRQPPN